MHYKYDLNNTINLNISGVVFDIERFAVNDGTGIRTIVFFKGCNLHCLWCANPESQSISQQIMFWPTRCIGCMTCVKNCPQQALIITKKGIKRNEKCVMCGKCTEVCNSMAMTMVGRRVTVEEVMREVEKDEIFYKETNGGVTFSGGEPFFQGEFLLALAIACKDKGYNTCIETSGYVPWALINKVKEFIDEFLYDFKCMNTKKHKEYTGVDNGLILKNYDKLVYAGKTVVARVPIIPGYNSAKEDLLEIADFLVAHNPGCRVDLLPYHALGVSKYNRLQMDFLAERAKVPSQAFLQEVKAEFERRGLNVSIGG